MCWSTNTTNFSAPHYQRRKWKRFANWDTDTLIKYSWNTRGRFGFGRKEVLNWLGQLTSLPIDAIGWKVSFQRSSIIPFRIWISSTNRKRNLLLPSRINDAIFYVLHQKKKAKKELFRYLFFSFFFFFSNAAVISIFSQGFQTWKNYRLPSTFYARGFAVERRLIWNCAPTRRWSSQ